MDNNMLICGIFIVIVVLLLALDLGLVAKKDRAMSLKESLCMSSFYIFTAFIFGLWVWYIKDLDSFAEYITGFLVEKSLALDNIFVILLIFSYFSIPLKYQRNVLFWGIFGVVILRGIMIGFGAHILSTFHAILYIFAAFMVVTGIKMLFIAHKEVDISSNMLLIWLRKHLRITDRLEGDKFFTYQIDKRLQKKKLFVTPLFIALIMIEFFDLIFAIDSIPAIFAITQDPYIVYTSNIFAILGLRALYFALSSVITRFYYLKYSIAVVLIFIGAKIFIAEILGTQVPPTVSLIITLAILACGICCSFIKKRI